MKIVFICGSLEPGRDGVGDYSRRLAAELVRQGHQASLLAINDRKIDSIFTGNQDVERMNVPAMRLPTSLPLKKRIKLSKEWIDEFNPSVISLQFVPFAFHDKGLSYGLANMLVQIGGGRIWHVMFHELWVGMNKEAPVKHLLWGWAQQRLIVVLLKKIKPAVIHTQTSLYLAQLQKIGFSPMYLPLFSNIPINNGGLKVTGKVNGFAKPKKISFVLFAGIHAGAPAKQFARDVAIYSKEANIDFLLTIIGRNGSEQAKWADAWAAEGMEVNVMGEQPQEVISSAFCNASAGISTTPFALTGKSGAVAAMIAHGLPVICVSYQWTPRHITSLYLPDCVAEYPNWDVEKYVTRKGCIAGGQTVTDTAREFVDSLLVD